MNFGDYFENSNGSYILEFFKFFPFVLYLVNFKKW